MMIGLHHPDLFQGGWKAMNQTTDGTVQGHLLVSMVTKSSLATENLECKQQEPVWSAAAMSGRRPHTRAREERVGPLQAPQARRRNFFT